MTAMEQDATSRVGTGARSPVAVPRAGWYAVAKRTWGEIAQDNVGLVAAGIAFYAFAAIVPLLGAVVLSYGLFADAQTVQRNVEAIFASLPSEAASVITQQLSTVMETSKDKQGIGLVIAIVLALYGATKGASAVVTGLNIAYEEEETRGFVVLNLLNVAIVIGAVALVFVAMATTALLGFLGSLIPGAPAVVLAAIRLVGYVALATLVVTASACLYRFAPARRRPAWVWLSPGSLAATLLWLAGTIGFGFYVANFGNYGATYGSLSAVIVMLTWLWLSAFVFLMGAELNAELERQVDIAPAGEAIARGRATGAGAAKRGIRGGTVAAIGLLVVRRDPKTALLLLGLAALSAARARRSPADGAARLG